MALTLKKLQSKSVILQIVLVWVQKSECMEQLNLQGKGLKRLVQMKAKSGPEGKRVNAHAAQLIIPVEHDGHSNITCLIVKREFQINYTRN